MFRRLKSVYVIRQNLLQSGDRDQFCQLAPAVGVLLPAEDDRLQSAKRTVLIKHFY
jgi:hypothetical protein